MEFKQYIQAPAMKLQINTYINRITKPKIQNNRLEGLKP